jgi:hypothetical protein
MQVTNRTSVLHGAEANVNAVVFPNVEYRLIMSVQMETGSQQLRLGYQIGDMVLPFTGGTSTVTANGWTELSGTATFPSTSHEIIIFIDSPSSATASFYVDSVQLVQVTELPTVEPPVSEDQHLQVFLDQTRQQIDGFHLSGAFRQIDHLLNGFADNPEIQREVLDLVFGHHTGTDPWTGEPVDPAARGIGLSIWRNQISDKAELWNYLWRQPPGVATAPNAMAGGGGAQSWGRWFDSAAFSFRPFHPHDPDHYAGMNLPLNAPNLDDASYRWWFDARPQAAVNWDPAVHADPFDRTHIPTIAYPLGNPAHDNLSDNIGIDDNTLIQVGGQWYPGKYGKVAHKVTRPLIFLIGLPERAISNF